MKGQRVSARPMILPLAKHPAKARSSIRALFYDPAGRALPPSRFVFGSCKTPIKIVTPLRHSRR